MSSGIGAAIVCLVGLGLFLSYVGSTSPIGLEAGNKTARAELRRNIAAIQSAKNEGFVNYQNREIASWQKQAAGDFDEMLKDYRSGSGYWWNRLMDTNPDLFPI